MTTWDFITILYAVLAILTFMLVLVPMWRGVKLHPGGDGIADSKYFTEEAKRKLLQNFSRINGTLGFWKQQAIVYRNFHSYCFYWTVVSSWLVPLLATLSDDKGSQKWLIVVVSSHVALALSFHRGLHVLEKLRGYRLGESQFYDLYRRLLDRPMSFGSTETEQLDSYFIQVEKVRVQVRNAEIGSLPSLEQASSK